MKQFLEKELSEDDLEKQVRTWDTFEDCTRGTKNIEEFLSDFGIQEGSYSCKDRHSSISEGVHGVKEGEH